MREIIVDVPLEQQVYEEKLFEYTPVRKARKIRESYQGKVKRAFASNFMAQAPIFKPQGSREKKNVVIKNIGNMKLSHLKNALDYTIDKSYQEFVDLFNEYDIAGAMDSILSGMPLDDEQFSEKRRCGIDEVGNLVSVEDILKNWREDFSSNTNTNEALHLVFSLNETKSDSLMDILLESTKATMQSHFAEYKYVLVPHAHQNQPHIHIIINKTNIFTRKKLHFESKSACANFYDGLREDFKQNLFVLSNGKLDYTNDVRFDKEFRQEHLDSKIQALESFEQNNEPMGEYESDVAFLKEYKNAITSVSAKKQFVKGEQARLRKEIKHSSIYLKNIEKKIESLSAKGKTPTKLQNKRLELLATLSNLSKDYEKSEAKIEALDSHIKRFLDWEDTYKSFCKNFTLHNKKKSLIDTFKGYEEYLPTSLVQKLNAFKRDVARFEHDMASNMPSVSEGVQAGLLDFSPKSNAFVLSKNLSKLVYYKNIVATISFDENQSLAHKKENTLQSLEDSKAMLLEQIHQRLRFVADSITESKDLYKKYLKTLDLQDKDCQKAIERLYKKLSFLSKEFKIAKDVLQKHNIPLPFTHKEAFSIESQTKNLSAPEKIFEKQTISQAKEIESKPLDSQTHTPQVAPKVETPLPQTQSETKLDSNKTKTTLHKP